MGQDLLAMLTTKLSLKRQSWLVAGVCMVADGGTVVLHGCVSWQNWLVLAILGILLLCVFGYLVIHFYTVKH